MTDGIIRGFFENEKIEYYAALDYKNVREINPRIRERHSLDAKSVIIFLVPYYAGKTENLSKYSAARDYHLYIKDVTARLISILRDLYPDNNFVGFGDHSPIDERSAALAAGLGILGDNGLLINEKYGTYVFLADVISDLAPEKLGVKEPKELERCEGCGACRTACPTGILAGKSSECLSAITQKKGDLSDEEVSLMKKYNTVWGCDACQDFCPHNINPKTTPIDFFLECRIEHLTGDILNSMSDEEFSKRAFAWRGRKTVARNLEFFENN